METDPILPIPKYNTNEKIDLHRPPTTPYEYMKRVRHEALNCAQVVVANIDTSQFEKNITYQCPISNEDHYPVPPSFIPANDLQIEIVEYFVITRERFRKIKSNPTALQNFKKPVLPSQNSDQDWYLFCFGKQITSSGKRESTEETAITPTPPYLSLLINFRLPLIIRLLGYLTNWIDEEGFDFNKGSWIYALLTPLEKPLSRDAYHILRTLAKLLRKLRSELDSKDNILLHPLNVLICLITIYFGQRDLADDPTI